jgi:LacI family transcriptional regulator
LGNGCRAGSWRNEWRTVVILVRGALTSENRFALTITFAARSVFRRGFLMDAITSGAPCYRAVSMRTVAELAGVSVMTVSRALRNAPRVSPVTCQRVRRAAESLGYQPNPLVSALIHQRRRGFSKTSIQTIAFVTSHSLEEAWRTCLTPAGQFAGGSRRAAQLGFRLEPIWSRAPGMSGARLSAILRARGIYGVVIAPAPEPRRNFDLRWEHFAAVALGHTMPRPAIHRVANHQLHTVRAALEELTRRGFRRIGLAVSVSHDDRVDRNWTGGCMQFQRGLPPEHRVRPFVEEPFDPALFEEWLRVNEPDAVVAGREMLVHLVRRKQETGTGPAVAALDHFPEFPDVAGIDQNNEAIGAAAVDLVVEQLYNNERGIPICAKVVLIEGKWRDVASVSACHG